MSIGAVLGWLAGGAVAILIAFAGGVWIGGEIESDVHMEILTAADMPSECWDKIEEAALKVVETYKGGADAQ